MRYLLFLVLVLGVMLRVDAAVPDPFSVTARVEVVNNSRLVLRVSVAMPADHHIYADAFGVAFPAGVSVTATDGTLPVREVDKFSDETREVYSTDFERIFTLRGVKGKSLPVTIGYQGCNASTCFFPKSRKMNLPLPELPVEAPAASGSNNAPVEGGAAVQSAPGAGPVLVSPALLAKFRITGRETGYVGRDAFATFLGRAGSGTGAETDGGLMSRGVLVMLLLVLLGGFALNLTPCILPMIPVNIAIIGAGVQAGSKFRGFLLGATYGVGIALAYGILGLVVILTGAKFGALNASPWFNFGIAAVFLVLAMAMFEVFLIDLSRFQGGGQSWMARGGYGVALILGAISALLAGACVAPAVISVMVLAASLQAQGNALALLLPFLLGIGMALPWPFAGAGIAFLPRPGMWMKRVNRIFGAVILAAALYYAYEGAKLLLARTASQRETVAAAAAEAVAKDGWETSIAGGLERSLATGKPVLVDFWATWCKSCLAMEKTTLRDPAVRSALDGFVKVKYNAEQPDDPSVKQVLDQFGVLGMPTYIVLRPVSVPAVPKP